MCMWYHRSWELPTAGGGGGAPPSQPTPTPTLALTSALALALTLALTLIGGGAPPSQPSYAQAPRQASPDSRLEAIDRDAAMARELAAQFDAEAGDDSGNEEDDDAKGTKKEWASDASTTNCFLTDVKFGVVQRKHHCRYCGQIFVAEVCKKTTRIPSIGYTEPVRVCDVCFDQVERGDPVCLSKQAALLRS